MSYHHLTTYERGCIEVLHKFGYKSREIAQKLDPQHRHYQENKTAINKRAALDNPSIN